MKKIPIGISDFKTLIEENYYFIDKSLFIKDIIDDGSKVILISRPRRFGKTLNMSMLKYFYEKSKGDNKTTFKNLKINEYKEIMDKQGQYPVIYLTFKDVKDSSWEKCSEKLVEIISKQYDKYNFLIENNALSEAESIYFKRILLKEAKESEYETSLKNLSEFLSKYYNKNVVILIDEYDVPIQSGYLNNFYDNIIEFMRNFLTGGLKDNSYIEKAVLTGILRIAKESIFSGLNNLKVSTLLSNHYSNSFGFLDEEVEELLKYYGIEYEMDDVRGWYNGYMFGRNTIYNPWSILNYIDNEAEYKPYWVNTSSNDLIKRVLARGGETLKMELESLVIGETIEKIVNENIVMHEIELDAENAWSFLLFSGYLKVIKKQIIRGKTYCILKIPNLEVQYLYEEIILSWFSENISKEKFNVMLKALVNGDIKVFSKVFKEFVLNSLSYFDASGEESEKVYHAFVLGMLVALCDEYEVKSNRESGYGRYDVMIIKKDGKGKGIIIEFKKVDEDEDLEKAADNALKQIYDKNYKAELISRGINDITELGIAFSGKEVLVKEEKNKLAR